jgi:hypothetical protein
MFRTLYRQSLLLCYGLTLASATAQQRAGQEAALLSEGLHEKNYAVRFVYNPPVGETHVVTPTTFRQVETEDPRFDTWSTRFSLGLTMWISPQDMKRLAEGLGKLNLAWTESNEPMVFREELVQPPPPEPHSRWKVIMPRRVGTMEVDVTCDAGSTVADLASERVCPVMEELERAFTTPTALYIFRSARDEWGCEVPGFNPRESLPTFITESEAAILINLLPIASELRSKGSEIDWQVQNYSEDSRGLNGRDYWFFLVYKGPRKAKGSAPIGRFAVNEQTADVWDRDSRELVHSCELEAVQAVLRREHNISAAWIDYYRNHPLERGGK